MSGISNYLTNKLDDFELRGQVFTPPATDYVALLLCSNGPIARSTAYALGNTVSMIAADGYNHLYSCTTAGTSAAAAPTYPGKTAEAITDGTAVFTEQGDVLAAAGASMVEVSGGAYARVAVASSLADWSGTQGAGTALASTGTSATISNNATITFPTPTAAWETAPQQVWGFATFDAATAGNLLRFGGLAADQIINTGNGVSFAAGQLVFKTDQR
jgi:hypothetical protein